MYIWLSHQVSDMHFTLNFDKTNYLLNDLIELSHIFLTCLLSVQTYSKFIRELHICSKSEVRVGKGLGQSDDPINPTQPYPTQPIKSILVRVVRSGRFQDQ